MQIVVMANSMVYPDLISGGDKLFLEISKYLDFKKYEISVVTTEVGHNLWQKLGPEETNLIRLPISIFERFKARAAVPFIYLMRTIYACQIILPPDRPLISL